MRLQVDTVLEVALRTTFAPDNIIFANMLQYVLKSTIEYFFASRGLNLQIQDELKEKKLSAARKVLKGQRPHSEVRIYVDQQTGRQLLRR